MSYVTRSGRPWTLWNVRSACATATGIGTVTFRNFHRASGRFTRVSRGRFPTSHQHQGAVDVDATSFFGPVNNSGGSGPVGAGCEPQQHIERESGDGLLTSCRPTPQHMPTLGNTNTEQNHCGSGGFLDRAAQGRTRRTVDGRFPPSAPFTRSRSFRCNRTAQALGRRATRSAFRHESPLPHHSLAHARSTSAKAEKALSLGSRVVPMPSCGR